jgi:hypothetical protein
VLNDKNEYYVMFTGNKETRRVDADEVAHVVTPTFELIEGVRVCSTSPLSHKLYAMTLA